MADSLGGQELVPLSYARTGSSRLLIVVIAILAIPWGLLSVWVSLPAVRAAYSAAAMNVPTMSVAFTAAMGAWLVVTTALLLCRARAGRVLLLVWAVLNLLPGIAWVGYAVWVAYPRWPVGPTGNWEIVTPAVIWAMVHGVVPSVLALTASRSHWLSMELERQAGPYGSTPMSKIVAVLGTVWGAATASIHAVSLLGLIVMTFATPSPSRSYQATAGDMFGAIMKSDPVVTSLVLGSVILTLMLSSWLLGAAVAALRGRPSAKGMLARWAVAWLLIQILSAVAYSQAVYPRMLASRMAHFTVMRPWPAPMTLIGGSYHAALLNVALPVLALVCCLRRSSAVEPGAAKTADVNIPMRID